MLRFVYFAHATTADLGNDSVPLGYDLPKKVWLVIMNYELHCRLWVSGFDGLL
jgi:hypothetical protein